MHPDTAFNRVLGSHGLPAGANKRFLPTAVLHSDCAYRCFHTRSQQHSSLQTGQTAAASWCTRAKRSQSRVERLASADLCIVPVHQAPQQPQQLQPYLHTGRLCEQYLRRPRQDTLEHAAQQQLQRRGAARLWQRQPRLRSILRRRRRRSGQAAPAPWTLAHDATNA